MNYKETVEWLYNQLPMFASLGPGAYKPGLATTRLLAQAFDNPHHSFKSVHIAGTNGKGSVSHTIAASLRQEGYKVGLYTSPHLVDFRERIMVNGQKISQDFVVDFINTYQKLNLDCSPTFFELTTIMAFRYFESQKVDFAVIETGLGGRLDSTNIINPELCIITNISLDHTALLGLTEEEIAYEKGGIIKENTPVIIGSAEGRVREIFQSIAESKNAVIDFAQDQPVDHHNDDGRICFKKCGLDLEYALLGEWQIENGNTALHALEFLPVSLPSVATAMKDVNDYFGLQGRWQTIRKLDPTVICDTGHNPGAWKYLGPRLKRISEQHRLRMVLGFANDKDIAAIIEYLPLNADYYFVQPAVKRAAKASDLLHMAMNRGVKGAAFPTVEDGYKKALSDSGKGDFVFVGGSNYVVAEVL